MNFFRKSDCIFKHQNNKEEYYFLKISDLEKKFTIKPWSFNRPVDDLRVEEIKNWIFNEDVKVSNCFFKFT